VAITLAEPREQRLLQNIELANIERLIKQKIFALEAQQHVPLAAPVVGRVSRRVLDHAHADRAAMLRAPQGDARFARMLGRRDRAPVDRAKGNVVHLHGATPTGGR
jgi:hypothetical protein